MASLNDLFVSYKTLPIPDIILEVPEESKFERMVDYIDYVDSTPETDTDEVFDTDEINDQDETYTPAIKTYKKVKRVAKIRPGKLRDNAKIAYNYFINNGIPAASAAGIVGNLYREDLGNPLRTVNDSRGTTAYGIAGFNSKGDLPNLLRWSKENGIQGNPGFEDQLRYLVHVINSGRDPKLTAAIMNPNATAEDASYAWGRYFERFAGQGGRGYLNRNDPEHVKRGQIAAQLYSQFHG